MRRAILRLPRLRGGNVFGSGFSPIHVACVKIFCDIQVGALANHVGKRYLCICNSRGLHNGRKKTR